MIALWIVLAHLVGDYLIQSHWMATEKTKRWLPAIMHGITYTLPYALITQSPLALIVIGGTHIIIDRFRLARHIAWFKNQLGPKRSRPQWADAKATGYPSDTPAWLSVWLMIIADNTIHLMINTAAIIWLK
jgi:hypothetical protein